MQEWTPVKTNWEADDVPPVTVFNRIEGNTLHLKETPEEDFELMGKTGTAHAFVYDWHREVFKTIKRIPARSRLYIREASKVCEGDDADVTDFELLVYSISDYPADSDLTWYTAPFSSHITPNDSRTRWWNNVFTNTAMEHHYHDENEGRGHLIMENSTLDPVDLVFIGRLCTYYFPEQTIYYDDRDMLYMKFHVEDMDVEETTTTTTAEPTTTTTIA